MTDLIARLEQAESGSRELSDQVLLALGFTLEPSLRTHTSPTESVDDALGLVPEGYTVAQLGQDDKAAWWAELRHGYRTSYTRAIPAGPFPTPALSLCIAILKAHLKAQEGEKG